jgi:hypothetical protein
MNEDFLIYIWRYQLYSTDLQTTQGETIVVKNPGVRNRDSGPVFSGAVIRIGRTLWAGNVEIHVRTSDWIVHGHHEDGAYGNVILHVVYEHDKEVTGKSGSNLPTLELAGKFDERLYHKYRYFLNNGNRIPCSDDFHRADAITKTSWLERLLVERLERKTKTVEEILSRNKNDWETTFYQVLAGNFGFKVNQQPFTMLATGLPLNILLKHRDSTFRIEALLTGQAGLLNDNFKDDYPMRLKKEYDFLRKKYGLVPMEPHLWKFMRLRPVNFPTIRLSQFAALIAEHENMFSNLMHCQSVDDVVDFFDIRASSYWNDHYTFDNPSPGTPKKLGISAVRTLIINTVVQFMYLYGTLRGKQSYRDRAVGFLLELPAEKNTITRQWEKLPLKAENALESQALLELKSRYCNLKRCLDCAIGVHLLKNNNSSDN